MRIKQKEKIEIPLNKIEFTIEFKIENYQIFGHFYFFL